MQQRSSGSVTSSPVRRLLRTLTGLPLAALLLASSLHAQAATHVKWSAAAPAGSAPPGAIVLVTVTAEIADGWHVYSVTQPAGGPLPLKFSVPPGQPFALAGEVTAPAPHVVPDRGAGFAQELYSGTVSFVVPVRLSPDAGAGEQPGTLRVRHQVCSDQICLPPRTEVLTWTVRTERSPTFARGSAS